jgi:MoxR-like ATPase
LNECGKYKLQIKRIVAVQILVTMRKDERPAVTDLGRLIVERLPPLFVASQSGDQHSALVAMRRFVAQLRDLDPELANDLNAKTFADKTMAATLRRVSAPGQTGGGFHAPTDRDTQASLLRTVDCSGAPKPTLPSDVATQLENLVAEHEAVDRLLRADLIPRSTIMLVGPPGVGKTMAAKWLASRMRIPLAQIELSSTVSSYLGRTGQNLREVLDYARSNHVVLLLDEFDAISKRRDDQTDLGELKRIVSVLLKELEEWSGPSIVIAATNHPELIDSAVFRRFQMTIKIGLPDAVYARDILRAHMDPETVSPLVESLASELLDGASGSDIRDVAHDVRRAVCIGSGTTVDDALLSRLGSRARTVKQRKQFCRLVKVALPDASYERIAAMLGVVKSSIFNYLKD